MIASEVSLSQILEARERRAALQQSALREHGGPLLCFTMNLAGPIKRSPLADFAFLAGERMIAEKGFKARQHIRLCLPTGCEALYAFGLPAPALKAAAMALEDSLPVCRLFDLDVIGPDGIKLSRPEQRPCLVCGGPAAACGRSRAHGLSAVQEATHALLADFAMETLAAAARQALLEEVYLTPKPGLVDRANAGAHRDMDLDTFARSADALLPYFRKAVGIGLGEAAYAPAMASLRREGLWAEEAMLAATGGANTHKGLIYSLGLLLCGLGQSLGGQGENYILHAKRLASVGLEEALQKAKRAPQSHGERIYAQTGLLGARGEARAGFPTAVRAHEALRSFRLLFPESEARILALLSAMAELTDTNLLHRGGEEGLRFVQREARRILAIAPSLGPEALLNAVEAMDTACTGQGLSPGGSADMLALALFLDQVEGWMP